METQKLKCTYLQHNALVEGLVQPIKHYIVHLYR